MRDITSATTLEELAALVSQALERAGITATLSGGAAVSLYTDGEYVSSDLDFVSSEQAGVLGDAIAQLGFRSEGAARQFEHPNTQWFIEFPPGPVAFGEAQVGTDEVAVLETEHGPIRIVTPTQIIMDRLAAYEHWNDGQSFDQAILVAKRQSVNWPALRDWARNEGIAAEVIDRLEGLASEEAE